MTTTSPFSDRLAALRSRGFTITRTSPVTYVAADAYGDGSTDLVLTVVAGTKRTVSGVRCDTWTEAAA